MASLRIGVPPGTVVKKKKGGQLLGELINPGVRLSSKHILFLTDTKVGCETGGNEKVVPHLKVYSVIYCYPVVTNICYTGFIATS